MIKFILSGFGFLLGIGAFVWLLFFIGIEDILHAVSNFNPFYILLFVLASFGALIFGVIRWKVILKYHNHNVGFFPLVKYHLMGFAISYITPSMRVGGEPLKALMLQRHHNIRLSQGASSVVLDTGIGATVDVIFASILFLVFVIFSSVSIEFRLTGIFIIAIFFITAILFYLSLLKRRGPFSSLVRVFYHITRLDIIKKTADKLVGVENLLVNFLQHEKTGLLKVILLSLAIWPFLYLQFWFAFLAVGFQSTPIMILVSLSMVTFTSLLPIPAAIGVQEAGQYSVLQGPIGVVISLIIRIKHILFSLLGFFFISHEGLSSMGILRKK